MKIFCQIEWKNRHYHVETEIQQEISCKNTAITKCQKWLFVHLPIKFVQTLFYIFA